MFAIAEETYRDATLEVLSTIKMDHRWTSFDRASSIRFQLFGEQHALSYTDFALLMGLYDSEFSMARITSCLLTIPQERWQLGCGTNCAWAEIMSLN